MNPETNRFEQIHEAAAEDTQASYLQRELAAAHARLLRADGSPVPDHWSTFRVDERVVVKGYTFRVGYIGESTLLLEPVGPDAPIAADGSDGRLKL